MFVVLCALVLVCLMCLLYVSLGSIVSPRILGCMFVSRGLLSMLRLSLSEYSAGSGVKSVVWVLFVFSISLLFLVHCTILLRYVCICCWAICCLGWVAVMVMSSAYVIMFMLGSGGVGRSAM